MTLSAQLDEIRAQSAKRIPADALTVMQGQTQQLRNSGARERVIRVGAPLPPFELENERGELVRSADVLSRGPLLLSIYRGVW